MLIFLVILIRMTKLARIHPQTEFMHSLCSVAGRGCLCHCLLHLFFLKSLYMFVAAALTCEPSYHNFMIPVRLWPCNYMENSFFLFVFHATCISAQALRICIQSFWFPRIKLSPECSSLGLSIFMCICLGWFHFIQNLFVGSKVSFIHIIPYP